MCNSSVHYLSGLRVCVHCVYKFTAMFCCCCCYLPALIARGSCRMKEEGEEKGESGMDRHGGKDQGRETSPQNKQKILDAKGEVRLKSRSGKTDEPN